jgi:hypothetical protein
MPTTYDTDPYAAEADTEDLSTVMKAEFLDWETTLARMRPEQSATGKPHRIYPHPDAAGGLPHGWMSRWTTEHPAVPARGGKAYVSAIVHRAEGGWGAVVFYKVYEKTPETVTMLWAHGFPTLEVLYRNTYKVEGDAVMKTIADDLHQFVCAAYDLTNPVEAAEATVTALGGEALVFPAALTEKAT